MPKVAAKSGGRSLLSDCQIFLIDLAPDMVFQLVEFRGQLGFLCARIWNIHIYDILNPARPRAHDDDALGKDDGLFHIMRDEEAGLFFALDRKSVV